MAIISPLGTHLELHNLSSPSPTNHKIFIVPTPWDKDGDWSLQNDEGYYEDWCGGSDPDNDPFSRQCFAELSDEEYKEFLARRAEENLIRTFENLRRPPRFSCEGDEDCSLACTVVLEKACVRKTAETLGGEGRKGACERFMPGTKPVQA